jgi:hypothetical protein
MIDDVTARLLSLGYTVMTADTFALTFLIDKVTNTIKNECNIDEIPDELHQVAVDMVCGEFLKAKQANGSLDESEINTEAAIKSIKEGDTQITYAISALKCANPRQSPTRAARRLPTRTPRTPKPLSCGHTRRRLNYSLCFATNSNLTPWAMA